MSKLTHRSIELALLALMLAACSGSPSKPTGETSRAGQPAADPAVVTAFQTSLEALQAGRYAEAESGFRKLTQQSPQHRGPWLDLAIALRRQDKIKEARELLVQVVKRYPDFAEARNELALLQRMDGHFTEARRSYEAAIANRPDFALAYRNLGLLCDLYLHDNSCALSNYQKYQQIKPGNDKEVEQWIADLQRRMKSKN